MKTKKIFLILVAATFGFTVVSCSTKDLESCDSQDVGAELCTNNFSAVATFCSDGVTNSYYTYNGDKYLCTGVDANTCDAALQAISVKLIENGCTTAKSASLRATEIKLSEMAEKLLLEVKNKSLCN